MWFQGIHWRNTEHLYSVTQWNHAGDGCTEVLRLHVLLSPVYVTQCIILSHSPPYFLHDCSMRLILLESWCLPLTNGINSRVSFYLIFSYLIPSWLFCRRAVEYALTSTGIEVLSYHGDLNSKERWRWCGLLFLPALITYYILSTSPAPHIK